jgi:hypothetical protein
MADTFTVRIDLVLLHDRLKWNDGTRANMDETKAWLRGVGFVPTAAPDVWIAEEISLGR